MKTVAASLVLFFSLIFAGCVVGPRFSGPVSAPSDKAIVYVYYRHAAMIPRPPQDIFINGQKAVHLQTGSYYLYQANPGDLVFSDQSRALSAAERARALKTKAILQLGVDAGRIYYVEYIYVNGIPRGDGSFMPRDKSSAVEDLADCSPANGAEFAEQARPAAATAEVAPAPVERKYYDSVLTADCNISAETADEKSAADSLIGFLKEQKENRDFDQIAKIEFSAADQAKIVFTWSGGKHRGTLTVVRESGTWKITSESHSI